MIEHHEQAGEIDVAQQHAERRHQHAFDECVDDLTEGRPDDHRDREVDDVAAGDEVAKLLQHDASRTWVIEDA